VEIGRREAWILRERNKLVKQMESYKYWARSVGFAGTRFATSDYTP
jgi:hypothetical protein